MGSKKRIFGVLLIVTAVIIMIISGLGIFNLIPGAVVYEDMTSVPPESKYVKAEINIIFDTFGEEYNDSGEIIGEYAIIPYGEEYFMAVYLPERYIEAAAQVLADTQDYLNGKIDTLDNYFEVYGTIKNLDKDFESEFQTKMESISDNALMYFIDTDKAGYLPTVTVISLTAVSTVLVVCGIILIVCARKKKEQIDK